MSDSPRLGGFKTLNNVVWVSLLGSAGDDTLATRLCHLLAAKEVNLPFLTVGRLSTAPGVNFVVEAQDAAGVEAAIEDTFPRCEIKMREAAVFSLFPHKGDPLVLGTLLAAFGERSIHPLAMANSHSAVSVVLEKDGLDQAVAALFGPFHISGYRTPADWREAQKGKEALFKEVIASYREKRPKVYGLALHETQELVDVRFASQQLSRMGRVFRAFRKGGHSLTFLISLPVRDDAFRFLFSLTSAQNHDETILALMDGGVEVRHYPVTFFAMNGPHFGDRYGIAGDILHALDQAEVDYLGLGCSVASITGVLQAGQVDRAVAAIKGCYDVPTILFNT